MIPHLETGGSVSKERLDKLIRAKEEEKDTKDLSFLQSLLSNVEKWGQLTEKQSKALDKIEYLSSPEGKAAVHAWRENYVSKFRKKAIVCASYYLANPPYFNDIANNVMSNPEFVPTEPQYRAMCENNYTKRVLQEAARPPLFDKGSIVQIRNAQSLPWAMRELRGTPCVVIDNDTGAILTHAQGAKGYKILPFGHTKVFECQERYLKDFKRQKKASGKGEKDE